MTRHVDRYNKPAHQRKRLRRAVGDAVRGDINVEAGRAGDARPDIMLAERRKSINIGERVKATRPRHQARVGAGIKRRRAVIKVNERNKRMHCFYRASVSISHVCTACVVIAFCAATGDGDWHVKAIRRINNLKYWRASNQIIAEMS